MYLIIRGLVALIVFLIILLIIRKTRLRIWLKIVMPVAAAATVFSMIQWPVENYLFSFKTPENSYFYYYLKNPGDVLIGEDSALIIESSGTTKLIKKVGEGYKLPVGYSYEMKIIPTDGGTLYVSYYPDSEDCYIVLDEMLSKTISIKDSDGNNYKKFDYWLSSLYYTKAKKIDDSFFIEVNGNKYEIKHYKARKGG